MTAVEWLEKELKKRYFLINLESLIAEAKLLEREQIEGACEFGRKSPHITGDQYYFCTYIDND